MLFTPENLDAISTGHVHSNHASNYGFNWKNSDVCPLMLALHAMECFLSGISGVRLGSVAWKFVGRELQAVLTTSVPAYPMMCSWLWGAS